MAEDTTATVETVERKERADTLDYKMVTFALAGKDYGIDIMNVKEIAKAGKFTYVPNAAPFLRGVYNLRGEIIPVIDLRTFFHLPAERKEEDSLESTLILRLDEHVFGVIVDNIDKVVSVSSHNIQPPHPIFGDINIKYIHGVIENANRLYIILDVQRIFSVNKEEDKPRVMSESAAGDFVAPLKTLTPAMDQAMGAGPIASSELDFIKETLFALRRFAASEINGEWLDRRFAEWRKQRKGKDLQLKSVEDADEFLAEFYSPCTDRFWDSDYAAAVQQSLPDLPARNIQVWNPGCGKGYETFSLACVLRQRYPEARIKVWASDNDLLAISNAPNMVFDRSDIPDWMADFMVNARNGLAFNQTIKDSVLFEYADILNKNPLSDIDVVFARDLLSFLAPADQARVFEDISEKLKAGGVVILGQNERLTSLSDWKFIGTSTVSAFMQTE